jgi:hypothetical protein
MDSTDLLHSSDLNLAEFHREMSRWHAETDLHEASSLLLTCGPDAFPALSYAMRTGRDDRPAPEQFFAVAKAYFGERRRGFSVQLRAHLDGDLEEACKALGLIRIAESPGMVLESPLPETSPAPAGTSIRMVRDVATARDFGSVSAESYASMGLRLESATKLFAFPERLLAPHLIAAVAYEGEQPLSAAMALLSHGIGGIYWVGTVPAGRKRGLAERCTRAVGNAAIAAGARWIVLQASAQGEPIYRRMGYLPFTKYPWYLCTTR